MQRAASRYHHTRRLVKQLPHLLLLVVVLLLALIPTIISTQLTHAKELQMWFFDIGQGDATSMQTPQGTQILVDGGPDDRVLQKLASIMLPWDRTLDVVVITHPDADHITGLVSVLKQYQVKQIWMTGASSGTVFDLALQEAIDEEGVGRLIKQRDTFDLDDLHLSVLWPSQTFEEGRVKDTNNTSIVLLAEYGQTSVLLTADAEAESEAGMQPVLQDIDVLKAGHHGSSSSSTMTFLQHVKPEVTIISAGVDNRYGHPHPVVLDRLSQIGSRTLRTDLDGDILLTSSGGEPIVES